MTTYLLQAAALLCVFAPGYLILEKAIPRTKRAYSIATVITVAIGIFTFLLFPQHPVLKASAWAFAWLGVIAINMRKKVDSTESIDNQD